MNNLHAQMNLDMVMIEITRKCNLSCNYCMRAKLAFPKIEMKYEDFCNIIKRLKNVKGICFCGMGEQMMHSNFLGILELVQDKSVIIITNGTVLIKKEILTNNPNIEAIVFSLDGPDEVRARSHCVQYNFTNLISNIGLTRQYGFGMAINWLMDVSSINWAEEMIFFCRYHGVKTLNILMHLYDSSWIINNREQISAIVLKIKKLASSYNVIVKSNDLACGYKEKAVQVVSCNSLVKPCCDYYNVIPEWEDIIKYEHFEDLSETLIFQKFFRGDFCKKCESRYSRLGILR